MTKFSERDMGAIGEFVRGVYETDGADRDRLAEGIIAEIRNQGLGAAFDEFFTAATDRELTEQ